MRLNESIDPAFCRIRARATCERRTFPAVLEKIWSPLDARKMDAICKSALNNGHATRSNQHFANFRSLERDRINQSNRTCNLEPASFDTSKMKAIFERQSSGMRFLSDKDPLMYEPPSSDEIPSTSNNKLPSRSMVTVFRVLNIVTFFGTS